MLAPARKPQPVAHITRRIEQTVHKLVPELATRNGDWLAAAAAFGGAPPFQLLPPCPLPLDLAALTVFAPAPFRRYTETPSKSPHSMCSPLCHHRAHANVKERSPRSKISRFIEGCVLSSHASAPRAGLINSMRLTPPCTPPHKCLRRSRWQGHASSALQNVLFLRRKSCVEGTL